jgi:hypothetical protein
MTNDPYSAVIADLVAKRDQLDTMIDNLRAMAGGSNIAGNSNITPNKSVAQTEESSPAPSEGQFLGMSIVEAAEITLRAARRKMKVAEIAEQLESGGMEFSSASVTNTIGSVLNRRMHKHGDIVSPDRGYWGLKEWYPGRTFGKKSKDNESETKSETSEPSQPSSQENVVPMGKVAMPGSDLL